MLIKMLRQKLPISFPFLLSIANIKNVYKQCAQTMLRYNVYKQLWYTYNVGIKSKSFEKCVFWLKEFSKVKQANFIRIFDILHMQSTKQEVCGL